MREHWKRQTLSCVPLASIILANSRSLRHKTEELQALVRHQHEYREACVLAVTETWLGMSDQDSDMVVDGFGTPLRTDRDIEITGKSRVGGVYIYK